MVAVKWFRLAAAHNSVKGETNLGIMYVHGKGVTQDFAEARKWFQRAADHGEVKAQSNLGALYATGKGVPQSYVEAAKWYGLAAKRGDQAAGSILEKIRAVQARQDAPAPNVPAARLEARSASLQMPPAPRETALHFEPSMFRFSAPVMESRTVSIGPPAGFHMMGGPMMGGHFGRR